MATAETTDRSAPEPQEVTSIVFEGFCDHGAGWDFDMPVFMIRPVKMYGEGGNDGEADLMVENYLIDLSFGEQPKDEDEEWGPILRRFRIARSGKSKRYVYWRQEVQIVGNGGIPDEDFSNVVCGPMQHGALNPEAAHD